jgi:tetratricopeptide (TPR) repeat protein
MHSTPAKQQGSLFMSIPPQRPFAVSGQAVFINREEPQQYFKQALAHIGQRDCSLLNFYGVGGIGKSCLQAHLKKAYLDKDENSVYSSVDFAVSANRQLHKTLETLVSNFKAESNIPFLAFGLAYIIYWEKAFPNQSIKKLGLPFLEKGSLLAGAMDFAESVGSLTSLGMTAVSYLYDKAKPDTFDDGLRDALTQLNRLQSNEIEESLPQFFAYDIQQYQNNPNSKKMVIFIDTYEALWQGQRSEANRLSQDQWLRNDLIANLPHVLFVISGREKIIWAADKAENWGDFLQDRQYLLGRLSDDDVRSFLQGCAINDAGIQNKMIADSGCVPYYLHLCVETFNKLKQQGQSPHTKGFTRVGKHKVFEYFMSYLDTSEIETLKVLAHAPFYSDELFSLLIEEFNTGYLISASDQLNSFSFISQQQDRFYIHDLMRKSLIELVQQQDSERSQRIYQFLFDHYNAQLQHLAIKNISESNLNALAEAFYYKTKLVGAEALSDWFYKLYDILTDAAQYKPALEMTLLLKQKIEDELGKKHLYSGTVLHNLAYVYKAMGKYDQAEPLYQRDLAMTEKALGNDHPSVATTLNNLARLYESQGNNDQAERLYQRSLEIREKTLGNDHPKVASSLNNLATLYKSQGKYHQAEPLYQRSLEIWEKTRGKNHPSVATTLNNLALLYKSQGKYHQAEPLYQRSLEIRKKALGNYHPDVGQSLNNLALLYDCQGKYHQAELLYQRDLVMTGKALGNDHPSVATTLNNLAGLYQSQGKYDQAESLYQRSLLIKEKAQGKNHPSVATTLNNLAELYKAQGKYQKAEPLYQRDLAITEKVQGKNHPSVATTLNNLAGLYSQQKKYKEAVPLFGRSLAILNAKFPNGHPDIDVMQGNLELLKSKMKSTTPELKTQGLES